MALFSFNNNTTTFKLPSSGEQTGVPETLVQTGSTAQTLVTGHVKGSERTIVRGAWFVAVFWNVINLVIFCGVLFSNHKDVGAQIAFMLLFSVIGVALLVYAIRESARLAKFGDPSFDAEFLPVPLGGRLKGSLTLTIPPGPVPPFDVTFSCINRVVTGSGKNRSVRENVLNQDQQTVTALPGGIIPIAFDVPTDGQETNKDNPSDCILWRLRATADFPGIPFVEQYEVPVKESTSLPPEQAALVTQAKAAHEAEIEKYQRPADSRIYVRTAPNGATEFLFSSGRNSGSVVFALVAFSFLAFFCSFVPGTFIHVVFMVIGLALLGVMLYLLFGTITVTIGSGQMEIRYDLLGFNLHTTTIPAADVIEIKTTIGATISGSGSGTRIYYNITVICQDGKATAGSMIADKMEAESLADQMSRCLKQK